MFFLNYVTISKTFLCLTGKGLGEWIDIDDSVPNKKRIVQMLAKPTFKMDSFPRQTSLKSAVVTGTTNASKQKNNDVFVSLTDFFLQTLGAGSKDINTETL